MTGLLAKLTEYRTGSRDPRSLHNLHPYPAKFIPELPREIIREHTNERHLVLDPFCGSGTTLLESSLLGRQAVGIDSHPIACLISRAKVTRLGAPQISEASKLVDLASGLDEASLPEFDESLPIDVSHWFQPNMLRELQWIRRTTSAYDPPLRDFLQCIFSSIITSASNQDSETRYAAVDKGLPDGYALRRFAAKLESALGHLAAYSQSSSGRRKRTDVYCLDATKLEEVVAAASVDLVVTSPPYPNSYDYYLYHRLRLAWLGFDPGEVRRMEIGSRYEHSSRRAGVDVYLGKMSPIFESLSRVLKPTRLAYVLIGDAVIDRQRYDMGDVLATLARQTGFEVVGVSSYDLGTISKSFQDTRAAAGHGDGARKMQRVLAIAARAQSGRIRSGSQARPTPKHRVIDLADEIRQGETVAVRSADGDRHVHGLMSMPSKFIPEIPRWALTTYGRQGALVLDPYSGSGTTAVEATILGLDSVSIDINPFASLVTEAKTIGAEPAQLQAFGESLLQVCRGRRVPRGGRPEFDLSDFWFNKKHLDEFAGLLTFVRTNADPSIRPYFEVVLASTIRSFSYQDESQIKVRRDPRKVATGTPSPRLVLARRLPRAIARAESYLARRSTARSTVITGDASLAGGIEADVVVTSPPYINSMNYPMATRYELLLLGLVDPSEKVAHESRYLGTERVYAADYPEPEYAPVSWPVHDRLNAAIDAIWKREPKRAFIVAKYFREIGLHLSAMVAALRPRHGVLVLVAGRNRIRGIPIDTAGSLASFVQAQGAYLEREFSYEVYRQKLKLSRHSTATINDSETVAVFRT